jgi:poly(A) polymerase
MSALGTIRDGQLIDRGLLNEGPLARALATLNGDGEETRVVGGAVRDLLLGQPVGDFDLATTALPDVVMRRARAAGFGVALTGLKHGTVTLIVGNTPIETTTLREDIQTDGRHALVQFGLDFRADAMRRDFTINALSLGMDGAVFDYTGGLRDLAARRVRFIGDAAQRIREDYLRILRFFRFSARYSEGELDSEGFAAAVAGRAGLTRLSRERVRAELLKLLVAPRAAEVAGACCDAGLLAPLLTLAPDPSRLRRVVVIEAARGSGPEAILRLAALGVRIVEDAERLREALRLSNAEGDRLANAAQVLAGLHGSVAPPSLGHLRTLLFEHGRTAAQDALTLAHAESLAPPDDPGFTSGWRFLTDTPQPNLPFTGADIIARGVAQGLGVGTTLKRLQALWIRAGFPKEPETLARLLDEALAEGH